MTVGIVGAGLGGMAAAVRLARAGCEVTVFEQAPFTGGKAASEEAAGYRFDTGPSLVTLPFVFRRLFEEAGESLERNLTFLALEPLCLDFFPGGTVLRESSDEERFGREMERAFGEDPAHHARYMAHARRVYAAGKLFLFRSIQGLLRDGITARELFGLARLDAVRTFHRANAAFYRDPRIVQLMDRFATFNGSDPYRAPATMCIIPAVEYGFGGYAVAGGIREIPRAYERLARGLGVRFHLGLRADRIVVERGRTRGIVAGGEHHGFDAVVSNVDARTTYRSLLPGLRDPLALRQESLEPSISGIVFLWGMGASFPELSTNNVFYSADYRREFTELFGDRRCASEPTVYVNVTSKTTRSDAPQGCENWFVLVNAPHHTGQDWTAEVARTRAAALRRIARALGRDVEGLIRYERVLTPADLEERTGSAGGSLYGIASNSRATAFLRHPNRHPRIGGLYFCGGSAHPGGGMPLVTLSGMIAADQLLRNERA